MRLGGKKGWLGGGRSVYGEVCGRAYLREVVGSNNLYSITVICHMKVETDETRHAMSTKRNKYRRYMPAR